MGSLRSAGLRSLRSLRLEPAANGLKGLSLFVGRKKKETRKGDKTENRLVEYPNLHYFYPVKLELLRIGKAGRYGNPLRQIIHRIRNNDVSYILLRGAAKYYL